MEPISQRNNNIEKTQIPGYDYASPTAARSPLTREQVREIEQTVGWSDADAQLLLGHRDIFVRYAEQMVDSWREVIGSQPHLAKWFFGPDGRRDDEYAARVKPRFVRWAMDVCLRPHDDQWRDYQEEIGLRHTPQKKNQTDHRQTPPLVPLRFLLAFIPVVTFGARRFFVEAGVRDTDLEKLSDAWANAVHLHVTLWTRPYAKEELW